MVRFIRDTIGTRLKIIPRATHAVVTLRRRAVRFGGIARDESRVRLLVQALGAFDALVAMRARIGERGFGVRVVR